MLRQQDSAHPTATIEPPPGRSKAGSSARERLAGLLRRFHLVRKFTGKLVEPLEAEDCVIQSMPDVSPSKWHLAHTTWFFDTFLLQPFAQEHEPPGPEYGFLFNSYYNAVGPMHCRALRGVISRPTMRETLGYRRHVDEQVARLVQHASEGLARQIAPLLELGIHHEQQHQELLLTDIKHVFAQNPLRPVYHEVSSPAAKAVGPLRWLEFGEGIRWTGTDGRSGFTFDNERPRHREFVEAFALGDRLVTCGEFAAFIEDGGYRRPELWLSAGWATVREQQWTAPLYWQLEDGLWHVFTLGGYRLINDAEPVCHVSYFEADAYARWAGARLPTEVEWESATLGLPVTGNFVEHGALHPLPAADPVSPERATELRQMFGDTWEWTRSSYSPYPRYSPAPGALGEYNGKFMCNQMTLRGGSCATAESHIRATYRNFFPPEKRWQFTGFRLARDLS